MSKIIVSGVGCCLVDMLYNDIDFRSNSLKPCLSVNRGDGGLTPGHLVFREEFEEFCGKPFDTVLREITGGRSHDKINIGGPSIVSLINIAQLVDKNQCEVRFYGRGGNDEPGKYLIDSLGKTPVILGDFKLIAKPTPSTVVLSDPAYENGHGERMFINSIAAAWDYGPENLGNDFFKSDIVVFGGTALVPRIHDNLTSLLGKAKANGCRTVVNTVFDFRSEKSDLCDRWPLGESDDSYSLVDLLITDREEALRLSGERSSDDSIRFFREKNVSSLIITNGSKNISAYSDGRFFTAVDNLEMPVSKKVTDELQTVRGGDTTGCGDNFAGGVIASVVNQFNSGISLPDLREACSRGIVSGGFTCFYLGGTFFEDHPGEKRLKIEPYYEAYRRQIED
ncbi:MAG TPA: carbohydrate kinase family protein [Bacteroidales bacterium]|nr:carbohydrate kinase family protein [Bacteroidales bacterium]HBH83910.1 carbohydrate kinase family protein [Bacteroidales bacterium]HBQ82078.1 carbohydrate kinase family protein [Bacteroidales bacterium]HCU20327.1 carbohydrate kinase family protein [Bacteroidales bacterium]